MRTETWERWLVAIVCGLLLIGIAIGPSKAQSRIYTGVIIYVVDGDTVDVVDDTMTHRVRIDGIDAPETTKPRAKCQLERERGLSAKSWVVATFLHAPVEVRVRKIEKWGRDLAQVVTGDGRDFATLIIAAGHARPWDGQFKTKPDWCAP